MRKLILLAILVFVVPGLLLGSSPLRADPAKDQLKKFEADMKVADEEGKVNLINEFAKSGNAGAAKSIAKFMGNRSTAVRVAAIKAVGSLKDKSSYGKLLGMIKSTDKEPTVLAAVLQAVGEYGNKGSLKELTKVAKKWLPKDPDVASAAARAIGKVPVKAAVEELIKLMDLTFPSSGGSGGSISNETRDLLAKSRPAIMEGLQFLTGWDFTDPAAWKKFWALESGRWKPSNKEIDMTTVQTWKDPGYGFQITRPAKTWMMQRGREVGKDYERYRIYMSHTVEGELRAYVFVEAYENTHGMTPQQKADSYEDSYRKSYIDIKEESYHTGEIRIGKEKGVTHGWTGMDASKNICHINYIYITHGPIIFVVGGWWRTGLDPKEGVAEQLKKAQKSFKFLD